MKKLDRIALYEALVFLGVVGSICALLLIFGGCQAVTPAKVLNSTGTYQACQTEGGVYEMDTRDGHAFIIMPEGVVDLGTPAKPTLDAIPRDGVKRSAPRTVRPESNL
jgi:hypothetical protein